MIDQENVLSTEIEQQLNLSIIDIKNFAKTAFSKYLNGIFELNPDVQFIYLSSSDNSYEEFISIYLIESEFDTIVKECFTEFKRNFGIRKKTKGFVPILCQNPLDKEQTKLWYPAALHELHDGILPIPINIILPRLKFEECTPFNRETHHDDGLDIFKQRATEILGLLNFINTDNMILYHRSGKQYSGFAYEVGPTIKVSNMVVKKI